MTQRHHFHHKFAVFVLCLGLGLTFIASIYVNARTAEREESRLSNISDELAHKIYQNLNFVTYGLGGANGVFTASKSVEYGEFKDYVASRNLPVEFPEVLGFGFIKYVKRAELADFEAKTRADDQPNFKISTTGNHPDLFIVKYLFPEDANRNAIGFDIGSERLRREAAERSILTGAPTLTKRITLIQDSRQRPGFLFLRPVFKNGMSVSTEANRRKAIDGWVFAPFTIDQMLERVINNHSKLVMLSVYEGNDTETSPLLFGENPNGVAAFRKKVISIGQQTWTIVVQARPEFYLADASRSLTSLVMLSGALLSLLLAVGVGLFLQEKNRIVVEQIAANISERQIAEEERNRLLSIIELSPDFIGMTDLEGNLLLHNAAARELIGISENENLSNLNTADIYPAWALEKMRHEAIPAVMKHGKWRGESTLLHRDGYEIPVEQLLIAHRDSNGKPLFLSTVMHDIRERKEQEYSLQKLAEELKVHKYALDESCIVAITDVKGKILYANDKFCEISKYSREELIGENHSIINSGLHSKEFIRDLWRTIAQGRVWRGDIKNKAKDGTFYWVDTIIVPFLDEKGKPRQYYAVRRDITQNKLFQLELEIKSKELLEARNAALSATQAKGEFLANMSHEIRTPLTSIMGYAESLLIDKLDEHKSRDALETIIRNGNHLLGVINDILDLSKIEAGKLDVEQIPVSVAEIVSDVGNLIMPKATEKGLSFGFEYTSPMPRFIKTDPLRLKQILINLVGNAIKFTSIGGVKINIVCIPEKEILQFAVVDTGIGLTEESRSRLFKAFSQADTSITRKFGGTGLGLIISSMLAQKLGGGIEIESRLGIGSTFILTISTGPLTAENLSMDNQILRTNKPIVQQALSGQKFRGSVLLAEDGRDNQLLITHVLKQAGLEVTVVENGELAVRKIGSGSFDLVFMDGQMPILDGYSATQKVRALGHTVPIVALTANAMKADIERAYAAGCTDFIGKPFRRSELVSVLAKYLTPVKF